MRPLQLDLERPRRPSPFMQAVLLAVALAFAGDVVWSYAQTRDEVRALRERLAQRPAQSSGEHPLIKVAAQPVSDEEYAFARETIGRLSTPWNALFQTLEKARIDTVAIVSVEPDPAARTITIRGEAKDYLAALSFVANLREQPALQRVHLVRHETASSDPRRPLQFSVSASWGGRS
jgi:hypothetical protein